MRRPLAMVGTLLAVALGSGCQTGEPPRFNPLPSGAATAPAQPSELPDTGDSTVAIKGELTLSTTRNFTCSYAIDDFFVRGKLTEDYQGVPVYLSINVEFYKRPGRYVKRGQVLVRRISNDNKFYASWYFGQANVIVRPNGGGADLEGTVTLPAEPGTESTRPVTIRGHFACAGKPLPGPG